MLYGNEQEGALTPGRGAGGRPLAVKAAVLRSGHCWCLSSSVCPWIGAACCGVRISSATLVNKWITFTVRYPCSCQTSCVFGPLWFLLGHLGS